MIDRAGHVVRRIAKRDDLVGQNVLGAIGVGECSFFDHVINAVITQSADVARLDRRDIVEQQELCVTTIHHIEAVGFESAV